MAQAWYLKRYPSGLPAEDDFELRTDALPPLAPGMVHVRNLWLSVDPYMRGRMNNVPSYVPPYRLDEPLDGAAVGQVVESRHDGLRPGAIVMHRFGWRDEVIAEGAAFTQLSPARQPQDYLNTLGAIGATAYFGLLSVGGAKAGETVFVSAAAGAVGSVVVQIAKLKGMRVIGSAGGAAKCDLVRSLGADEVIDYKAQGSMIEKLRKAAPDGIDVYFDNVGGDHLDAALGCARLGMRVAICGMIDMYNKSDPVPLSNLFRVIADRIRVEGFLVSDFRDRWHEFRSDMEKWVEDGKVVGRESVVEGLEAVPSAFLGLFSGKNVGKLLVKL